MVTYKGIYGGSLRRYIKRKSHKCGFKIFVRAGVSGFISDFIPNQGFSTFSVFTDTANAAIDEEEEALSVGAAAVIAMSKAICDPKNSVILCDNWFPSLKLCVYLKEKKRNFYFRNKK